MLWEGSLVMIDEETGSLWSHLLGAAMRGPLEGAELEALPSRMCTWETWLELYPETTGVMMDRSATRYQKRALDTMGLVIGLELDDKSRSWPFPLLESEGGFYHDELAGEPLLATLHEPSGAAAIFSRQVGQRVLNFERRDGKVFDRETGSEWDLFRGVATEGELKHTMLRLYAGTVSDGAAWSIYHPFSTTPGADSPVAEAEPDSATADPSGPPPAEAEVEVDRTRECP